jgi:hypothetical protein
MKEYNFIIKTVHPVDKEDYNRRLRSLNRFILIAARRRALKNNIHKFTKSSLTTAHKLIQ